MTVPYENATSGHRARDEVSRLLAQFGCEQVGFMDNHAEKSVLLQFSHRDRDVRLVASAKGWAALWLKAHPHTSRTRISRSEHEAKALAQGMVAINSILRDWVKGQITAVECGITSFEAVFMAHMLAADGRPLIQHIVEKNLLPAPEGEQKEKQ